MHYYIKIMHNTHNLHKSMNNKFMNYFMQINYNILISIIYLFIHYYNQFNLHLHNLQN